MAVVEMVLGERRTNSPPIRPNSWTEVFSGSCPAGLGRGGKFDLSCDDVDLVECSHLELPSSQEQRQPLWNATSPQNAHSKGSLMQSKEEFRARKGVARRGSAIIFRSPKSMAQWARHSFLSFKLESPLKTPSEPASVDHLHNDGCQSSRRKQETSPREFTPSRENLRLWNFDVLNHFADALVDSCVEIFTQLELDRSLGIAEAAFRSFVQDVRTRMLDNPYHNWFHVVDVTQTVYSLGWQNGIIQTMSSIERLALIVAALCHDLEHPYGMDVALLEKHHSCCASELMTNSSGTGLLDSLDADIRAQIVERVKSIIFATDMTRHGEYMAAIRAILAEQGGAAGGATAGAPLLAGERQPLAAELLIKCADLSNVCRPPAVAKKWAVRITDEFFQQGDLERSMGLDVTPVCDRGAQSRVALQRGFIGFIEPFYCAMAALLPGLRPLLEQIGANRAMWERYHTDDALLAEFDRPPSL